MEVTVWCHNATQKDITIIEKVMKAGGDLLKSGAMSHTIQSFKKRDVLSLITPINIVCADFQPNIEGDQLVYMWPAPRTFINDETKKVEVWNELRQSVIPMLETIVPDVELTKAEVFQGLLSRSDIIDLAQKWKDEGIRLVLQTSDGQDVYIYPEETPGEHIRELTLNELMVLTFSLLALDADLVRVTRKGDDT